MRAHLRTLAILMAVSAGLAMTACGGGGVPADSVATVGGTPIKRTAFDHWFAIAAAEQTLSGGKSAPVVPDPPNYGKCVAALEAQPSAKGKPAAPAVALKQECQDRYESLKSDVMAFLVRSQWLLREARVRGVSATPAAVRKELAADVKRSYPKRADFQRFLKVSGVTARDLQFRAKVNVLMHAIEDAVSGNITVTSAQVTAYYNKNRKSFAQPERRKLLMVMGKTRARAQQAKSAILNGSDWVAVADRYSIAPRATTQLGKPLFQPKGQQPPPYVRTVFQAPRGRVEGPVKTPVGYLVFEVIGSRPASHVPLAKVRAKLEQQLQFQQKQAVIGHFLDRLVRTYQGQTECAKGFAIAGYCKNGPRPQQSGARTQPPKRQSNPAA